MCLINYKYFLYSRLYRYYCSLFNTLTQLCFVSRAGNFWCFLLTLINDFSNTFSHENQSVLDASCKSFGFRKHHTLLSIIKPSVFILREIILDYLWPSAFFNWNRIFTLTHQAEIDFVSRVLVWKKLKRKKFPFRGNEKNSQHVSL